MKSNIFIKVTILASFSIAILLPSFGFADEVDELEELEFDEELKLEDFELDDDELELDDLELDDNDLFEIDEDIDALLEEFEVDEEQSNLTDQYIISGVLGNTIPFGRSLKGNLSSGSNFGIRIDTPYFIFVGPFELNIGGEIYFSNMKSTCGDYQSDNEDAPYYIDNCPFAGDYKLTNITGSLSTLIEGISLRAGFGLSSTSMNNNNKTLITSTVDLGYKLPINVNPINISFNLHFQETLGVPSIGKGTTDIIGIGLIVGYPMFF